MRHISPLARLLLLVVILFSGCGSSFDEPLGFLGTETNDRVLHESWGGYRLYRYEAETWNLVVDLGREIGPRPLLGERPVLVIHGLGSNFGTGLLDPIAESLVANGATSIFGFEFDSLDPISRNATYLGQAMDYLTVDESDRTFRVVAHSMGSLVTRSSFESGRSFQIAATNNPVCFVAGPHIGTEIATALVEGDLNLFDQAISQLVLNGELVFENADGQLVDAMGDEESFGELALNSSFLQTLNFEASNKHPQFDYRTIAGTSRGDDYETFNTALGVFADDGLVNVDSANAPVIGQVAIATVPYDHSEIMIAQASLLIVLDHLGLLPR